MVRPLELILGAALATPGRPPRAVSVAPGAQPSERRTGTVLPSGSPMDTERALSWKSGLRKTPLATLSMNPAASHTASQIPRRCADGECITRNMHVYKQKNQTEKCHTIPLPVKETQREHKHGIKYSC